jgi:hypothetical protein
LRAVWFATAALFLSCGVGLAQLAPQPNASGLGLTSPLGMPGNAAAPVGPVGIPFGATGLSPGGLSPAPFDPTASNSLCSSAMPSGLSSGSTDSSAACGLTATAGAVSGTLPSAGGGFMGSVGNGAIPLGATELDNPGLSPMIASPAPSIAPLLATPAAPSSSLLGTPGPVNPTIRFGFSSAAGSGGSATGFTNFQPLGTSTAGGAGGFATGSTDRQTFGFSSGAGPGGRPTAPTVR